MRSKVSGYSNEQTRDESRRLLLIAIGVGLLWGPLALRSVANFSTSWAFAKIVGGTGIALSTLVEIAIVALILYLLAKIPSDTWQRVFAYIAIGCTVLTILIVILANSVTLPDNAKGFVSALFAVLLGCSSILPLALWGLCFAALNKRQSMRVMLGASVIGITVYLVFACVFNDNARWFLEKGCSIASLVLFLLITPCTATDETLLHAQSHRRATGYYVEQSAFGACLGCAIVFANMFRSEGQPNLFLSAAVLVLFLVMVVILRTHLVQKHDAVVPLIPMGACLFIVAPFVTADLSYGAQAMPAMLYIAWMTLTFVFFSYNARISGVASYRLVLLTLLITRATNLLVRSLLGFEPLRNLLEALSASTVFALLLAATFIPMFYATFRLVSFNNTLLRETIVSEAVSAEARNADLASQSVANSFGLTNRESEVFALLAKGHTRKFIAKELFISEGTVRTHIASIYRKTGCSSKEEVIALANDPTRTFAKS